MDQILFQECSNVMGSFGFGFVVMDLRHAVTLEVGTMTVDKQTSGNPVRTYEEYAYACCRAHYFY